MEKVKKIFKDSINAILTVIRSDLFKTCITFASLIIAVIAVIWGATMTVLTEDLTNVVIQKDTEIQELEKEVQYFSGEASRYKMISEEYYELFIDCHSNCSWYEDFYYNNVDPYTGEIEGEYYE